MASRLESFSKWLQLKIYQIEVTFSVYIYTPIEKFIFCASPRSASSSPHSTPISSHPNPIPSKHALTTPPP
jgi:hypothetical protein